MLEKTGKNATMVAQTTSEAKGLPTQTMISGAMATTGVTCSTTAQGWIAARAHWLSAMPMASPTPSTQAAIRAVKVTARVDARLDSSRPIGVQERCHDRHRSGHEIDRHIGQPHHRFPQHQKEHAEQDRRQAQGVLARHAGVSVLCIARVISATRAA